MRVLKGHKGAVFAVQLDDAAERVFSGSRDNVSVDISYFPRLEFFVTL